jgi:hypothetical protein
MQSYICYEKKDNIENFEMDISQFGGTINGEPDFKGQYGLVKTIWAGTELAISSGVPDEYKCAKECHRNGACTRYEYKPHDGTCKLFSDSSTLITKVIEPDDIREHTFAGYIVRLNQETTAAPAGDDVTATGTTTTPPRQTTKPAVPTTRGITPTQPVSEEEKKGISNLYLFIGLGVFVFIILIIVIIMMTGGSKDKYNDYY